MLSPLERKHFTVGIGWGRKLSGEVIQLPVSWESPYYMFVKQVMVDIRKKTVNKHGRAVSYHMTTIQLSSSSS